MVQPLWKGVWQFQSDYSQFPYDPAITLLGIFLKEVKIYTHLKTCTVMFIEALFLTVKGPKQTKCPSTDARINKMWYTHRIEYYLALKSNEVLIHGATWISLENIMLSERLQTKDHILYDSRYMKCPK